ncbi:hypothetical protein GCM10007977_060990 [Dactylosporangium sucinum]|uniref:Uncharacterized protein n=1 Tax=Dactylosporangium sucinum TaxID=1424081 RepID=A0A917X1N5_9ACTN|nr:hypothetical protein GCM10007977_060990 [Dactylosporangium sucinum]
MPRSAGVVDPGRRVGGAGRDGPHGPDGGLSTNNATGAGFLRQEFPAPALNPEPLTGEAVMAKVVHAARITAPDGAIWRTCSDCGQLTALPQNVERCTNCGDQAAKSGGRR